MSPQQHTERRTYGKYSFESARADKVLYPDAGITKGDVIDYYEQLADVMLPHLRERAVMIRRFPDGIAGEGFYQKQVSDHFPDWINTTRVSRSSGEDQELVVVRNTATLAYLADQGTLELHTWLSRRDAPDHPDSLVFDLDPPSADDFGAVRATARGLRELLDELELPAFLKTTGSKGLHVIVPLRPEEPFDPVRDFARQVAGHLVERHPDERTVEQRKEKRGGRVYVDVGRNAYAQTAIAPYSLRARPGAPVATPLAWEELGEGDLRSDRYTLTSVVRRLAQRHDPWAGWRRRACTLTRARQRLAEL